MTDHESHKGYTNYPTWLFASSIDNNEELYNFFKRLSTTDLSTIIKTMEELLNTDIQFMKDINECLLNYAKEQINLPEIARMMKEEN